MQMSQEQERSRERQRNRYQQVEDALQNYIYQRARRRAGRRHRWILEYLSTLPILAVTIAGTFFLQHIVNNFALEDGVLVLAFSIVALLWGWGPGLLLMFLGMPVLDFFFIVPYAQWRVMIWPNMLQLLPFILAEIAIGLLSLQRDKCLIKIDTQADELATAHQKLEDEALLKERFLSMTSHELKTPVTSILIQSQLLERRLKRQPIETAALLQALGTINERSHFLTSMIEELLDISRMQPHRATVQRKMHDMNVLCQDVLKDQRIITGRSILFQGSATPATVWGSYHRLTQVVNNIVSNAIKYSPASFPIEVSVKTDARHVIVQVHDHGPGIAQDHLDHIFEPFYRASTALSLTVGGLGLGLAITKQIVELHEGRIWCTSEQDSGCTFFVELPASKQEITREALPD